MEEATTKWVKFKNDGKLEGGNLTNQVRKTGTWTIDDKNKKISILSDNKSKDDGEYYFEYLDSNKLLLSKDNVKVYLVKTI